MSTIIDITGQVFGRLTAIKFNNGKWECSCSCGNSTTATGGNLRAGNKRSCGCLQKESNKKSGEKLAKKYNSTHGLRNHPIYKLWNNMMTRCYNKNYCRYKDWGGSGITVCKEWHDVQVFINWCLSNGWDSKLQLDRKDNKESYCPSNCRFVTPSENMANQKPIRSNNTSGYRGVGFNGASWCWKLTYRGKTYRGFGFNTAKDAAIARNQFINSGIPGTKNIIGPIAQ